MLKTTIEITGFRSEMFEGLTKRDVARQEFDDTYQLMI
jgi:hypothetical protein